MTADLIELSSDEDEDTTDLRRKASETRSTDTASVSQVPDSKSGPLPPVPNNEPAAKRDPTPDSVVNGKLTAAHQPSPDSSISPPGSASGHGAGATTAGRTQAVSIDRPAKQVTPNKSCSSMPGRRPSSTAPNVPVNDKSEAGPSGPGDKSPLREAGTALHRTAGDKRSEVSDASPSRVTMATIPNNWDPHKVRPYQCKYCYGKFLGTILLKKHEEEHEEAMESTCTPVPQYECTICNRRFLFQSSRSSHVLLKHPGRFIPPIVQPGDGEKKRKAIPVETNALGKKIKIEKEETDQKAEKVKKKEMGEKAAGAGSKSVPKKADTPVNRGASTASPGPVIQTQRPLRLNLDFTRDPPFEQHCPTCECLYRDAPTFQFHMPCYVKTTFYLANGLKCPSCPIPAAAYDSLHKLREHAIVHREPPFRCSYCGIRTQVRFEIELHVLQAHRDKLTTA